MLSCEAYQGDGRNGKGTLSNTGACRILLEGKHLFDFVDLQADLSGYKLLVLPDQIRLDETLAARVQAYVAQGGKVLLTGVSGLKKDADEFALDVGAACAGANPYRPDYAVPAFETVNGETAYVMYTQGMRLSDVTGTVLAYRQAPYFNRDYRHFCSHRHTPNNVSAPLEPAAVATDRVAYIGWNIFEDYATTGELIVKELALHAIDLLLGEARTIKTNLPDRGVTTVTRQGARTIVHLLFAHTSLRGKGIEVIEDAVPLHGVEAAVRLNHAPAKVYLAPEGEAIPFTWDGERVHFTVPQVVLHQMVAVE